MKLWEWLFRHATEREQRIAAGPLERQPVYVEDGSGAHVSWCPCEPCMVTREAIDGRRMPVEFYDYELGQGRR